MDGEIITSSQSSQTRSSVEKINILVVDDDATCLSIVAAILKTWKYEVVTVKHAIDALCTLRIMGGSFDLVVSDVHMPDMNGFELQKQIDREFNLPVVLMSADDKDCVIMKGLENGAALFLVKPIAPDDLKNLWQYAFLKKKKKKCKAVVDEIGCVQRTPQPNIAFSNEDIESESSAHENKKDSKRKVTENDHKSDEKEEEQEEEENDDFATTKKSKVVWTNTLHNKFLEAIKILGLDRAVPKKILEFMNVPGLTRENVASHLQKYRIFLKRVSDASYKIQYAAENRLADMAFRSNFVSGQPSLIHQNQMRTSFQPTLIGKHVPVAKASKHDHLSTDGSISRPLYGQSLLISNRGTLIQPMIGNSNSIHQTNRFGLNGSISSGLMTGTDLTQMYQKKTPLGSLTDSLSMYNSSKFGHGGANNSIGYEKLGNFKNSNTKSNIDSSYNSYVGYRIASENGGDGSNGFKGDYGLISGIQLSNMTTGSILSGNGKACLAKEMSSSSGLFVGSNPKFTNAIQEENGSVPQKKDNPVQEVESIDDLFGLLTNYSSLGNNSLQHGKCDLRSGFLNTQQGGGEDPHFRFSFSSNNAEDYHPVGNKQSLEKQHGEEDMDSNFSIGGSQLDDYFPWFDKSTKQQQGYDESFNNIIYGNQASPIQFDDAEFLESVFSDGAFGGSDGAFGEL